MIPFFNQNMYNYSLDNLSELYQCYINKNQNKIECEKITDKTIYKPNSKYVLVNKDLPDTIKKIYLFLHSVPNKIDIK